MKSIYDEMVMKGMKDHTGQWWEVIEECARCGACCMDFGDEWHFYNRLKGCCEYLELEDDEETYRCDLKGYRPFGCCGNNPHHPREDCSVVLVKIDDPTTLL